MQSATNDTLRSLPIRLLIADYKESSKAKALTMAIDSIEGEPYDIVVIMDADNLTSPDFLAEVNRAFDNGVKICTSSPNRQEPEHRYFCSRRY